MLRLLDIKMMDLKWLTGKGAAFSLWVIYEVHV